ncbi:MAG: OmpH family outer membrane protein [Myxococcota bacterium]
MRPAPLLAFLTLALASPALADLKLGYVDLQRALQEVHEGKEAKARLKSELDKVKNGLESEKNKLRADSLVLEKQAAMMSEEVRVQKYSEMQKKVLELTQREQQAQLDLAKKEQTELKKIFDKMDPIIAGIAQREGLAMVFEKSDSGLVYAPSSMDLTNELVRSYNEKYPAKGGKPAPAPAPKDAPKQ